VFAFIVMFEFASIFLLMAFCFLLELG